MKKRKLEVGKVDIWRPRAALTGPAAKTEERRKTAMKQADELLGKKRPIEIEGFTKTEQIERTLAMMAKAQNLLKPLSHNEDLIKRLMLLQEKLKNDLKSLK